MGWGGFRDSYFMQFLDNKIKVVIDAIMTSPKYTPQFNMFCNTNHIMFITQ